MNIPIKLGKLIKCLNCGNDFRTGRKHGAKFYCSRDCWKIHWKGKNTHMFGRTAWNKDKKTTEETKLKISLSKKGCVAWNGGIRHNAISQEKHWNWKGGISTKNHQLRNSLEWKLWREQVFERDGYRCIDCGERQNLEPHHILPKRDTKNGHSLFALTNGITLCRQCHQKTIWKEYELARTYFSLIPIQKELIFL